MDSESRSDDLSFDGPAVYRIRVKGKMRASWSERVNGLNISVIETDDGLCVTTLEGELNDQAGLTDVLDMLYELHLPVLSVHYLGARPRG